MRLFVPSLQSLLGVGGVDRSRSRDTMRGHLEVVFKVAKGWFSDEEMLCQTPARCKWDSTRDRLPTVRI